MLPYLRKDASKIWLSEKKCLDHARGESGKTYLSKGIGIIDPSPPYLTGSEDINTYLFRMFPVIRATLETLPEPVFSKPILSLEEISKSFIDKTNGVSTSPDLAIHDEIPNVSLKENILKLVFTSRKI